MTDHEKSVNENAANEKKVSDRVSNYYQSVHKSAHDEMRESTMLNDGLDVNHNYVTAELGQITSMDEHSIGLDSDLSRASDEFDARQLAQKDDATRSSAINGFDVVPDDTTDTLRKRSRNSVVAGSRSPE